MSTPHPFLSALDERVLLFDGAMGTTIQRFELTSADFGGKMYDGCNELLCLTRPDIIERIHRSYLEAGADVIETNSFGSSAIVLAEYGNCRSRLRNFLRSCSACTSRS